MKLTSDQVRKVAKLANLPLNDNDIDRYSDQLSEILDYIDQLNQVNTESIEPTFNLTGLKNVTRDDTVQASLSTKQAVQNTHSESNGLFVTQGVFNDE